MFDKKMVTLGLLCAVLSGCDWASTKKPVEKAKARTLYIFDVNSAEQYADAHIAGAEHVALDKVEQAVAAVSKETPVVVYCANYMCSASSSVVKKLQELGYTKAMAYEGGIAEWCQLHTNDPEYVVVGPAKQAYLKVVLEKPSRKPLVPTIEAQELKNLIKEANLL